jgi:hypothetical protein
MADFDVFVQAIGQALTRLAEISGELTAIKLQLDYDRAALIDSLGGEPALKDAGATQTFDGIVEVTTNLKVLRAGDGLEYAALRGYSGFSLMELTNPDAEANTGKWRLIYNYGVSEDLLLQYRNSSGWQTIQTFTAV